MGDLVGHHRGDLGRIIGEAEQPARHIELAGRQREGIDRRRVEDGDLVGQFRPLGCRHQPVDHAGQHRLQLGILIGAAIGRQHALVLALPLGRRGRELRRIGEENLRGSGRNCCVVVVDAQAPASSAISAANSGRAGRAKAASHRGRRHGYRHAVTRAFVRPVTTCPITWERRFRPRRSRSVRGARLRSRGRRAPRSSRAPRSAGRRASSDRAPPP